MMYYNVFVFAVFLVSLHGDYNRSVQYNGGLLPDIILLTRCYYHHRGTRLNAMKRFCIYLQPMIPPTRRFDIFSS